MVGQGDPNRSGRSGSGRASRSWSANQVCRKLCGRVESGDDCGDSCLIEKVKTAGRRVVVLEVKRKREKQQNDEVWQIYVSVFYEVSDSNRAD